MLHMVASPADVHSRGAISTPQSASLTEACIWTSLAAVSAFQRGADNIRSVHNFRFRAFTALDHIQDQDRTACTMIAVNSCPVVIGSIPLAQTCRCKRTTSIARTLCTEPGRRGSAPCAVVQMQETLPQLKVDVCVRQRRCEAGIRSKHNTTSLSISGMLRQALLWTACLAACNNFTNDHTYNVRVMFCWSAVC